MRVPIDVHKHTRSATALYKELEHLGLDYGCLPISIRAFGGIVLLEKIIEKPEEMVKISCLATAGLDVGLFVEIDEQIDGTHFEALLEFLGTQLENDVESTDFRGFLVLRYFDDDRALNNHFFAILSRESMHPFLKNSLIKQRRYMVVDSAGGKLIGQTHVDDFAEYINTTIDIGGKFMIFQVFKI